MSTQPQIRQSVLLRRSGLIFPPAGQSRLHPRITEALELELGELGYVPSARLRARLEMLPPDGVAEFKGWLCETLAAQLGADQKHTPLFRKFPDGIPEDTHALWVKRVLVHFLQGSELQCIFCLRVGSTHVLNPCEHVICEHCFDGESYSACPVCNRQVDESSPFFKPSPERPLPRERVRFKVLDVGQDLDSATRDLFINFCARAQAMSTQDRADLEALVQDCSAEVLHWLPATIPVKENAAIVFGTLFRVFAPGEVLKVATSYLRTATDVLRVLAVYAGADPALQGETIIKEVRVEEDRRWWGRIAELLGRPEPGPGYWRAQSPIKVQRFKLPAVARSLRRALFALLESFDPDLLAEDMLRQRSYWVWIGQLLHPHEYASRFPNVARAFAIVRKKSPSGDKAPIFQSFNGKVEAALATGDVEGAIQLLSQRPGELGRRLDHVLRIAGRDTNCIKRVIRAFESVVLQFPTPMLLTLRNHFLTRTVPAPVRVYWPKGGTAGGVSARDARSTLGADVVHRIVGRVEETLLARFGELPSTETYLIDRALDDIMVPFNERTASTGAISLPRGSTIHAPVPAGKFVRLFLHWCEPKRGGFTTDLDLSVALYASDWAYEGVCSYYELQCELGGDIVAKSAGDITSAPYPNGASEFVDIDYTSARKAGVRYAVMLVNAYSGMAFSQLDRAFAGYMVREDTGGKHFDARTVEMKFNLLGEKGIYVPAVIDLVDEKLHWLDIYSRGMPAMNNAESSNKAIQRICPEMIAYFGSGARMSMYDLALLHAAARARRVFLRARSTREFELQHGESHVAFLKRLRSGTGTEADASQLAGEPAVTCALLRGDIDLAPESARYVVFPERITGTLAAGDFLSSQVVRQEPAVVRYAD